MVDLDIDFDGTILGTAQHSRPRDARDLPASAAVQDPQPEIHLRPNKLVKYTSVAMVLAEAQRLGVTKIGLVGNEQFME